MIYPPPPGLIFLAYAYGSITKAERDHMLKLWAEKHREPQEEDDGK